MIFLDNMYSLFYGGKMLHNPVKSNYNPNLIIFSMILKQKHCKR